MLLLEREFLESWKGTDIPSDREGGAENVKSDYERASAVSAWVGLIPVRPRGAAIVFWGDRLSIAVITVDEDISLFVRPCYHIDNVECLAMELHRSNYEKFEEDFRFRAESGSLVLFDSAFPGNEIMTSFASFTVSAGSYAMTSLWHREDEEEMILHSLRRLAYTKSP